MRRRRCTCARGQVDAFQLDGGILGYFEEVGGDHFDGECFVFDEREALTPDACRAIGGQHHRRAPAVPAAAALPSRRYVGDRDALDPALAVDDDGLGIRAQQHAERIGRLP